MQGNNGVTVGILGDIVPEMIIPNVPVTRDWAPYINEYKIESAIRASQQGGFS